MFNAAPSTSISGVIANQCEALVAIEYQILLQAWVTINRRGRRTAGTATQGDMVLLLNLSPSLGRAELERLGFLLLPSEE